MRPFHASRNAVFPYSSMHFIVKYFPEITIKSQPVRKRFVRQLVNNLTRQLNPLVEGLEVRQRWDRLEVLAPVSRDHLSGQVRDLLASTPGIAWFARGTMLAFDDLEELARQLVPLWRESLAGKTFCVRVKRSGQHDFNSVKAEQVIGAALNHQCDTAGVRLTDPEVLVRLEISNRQCFMFLDKIPGLGGFPLGTQGHVLSLVSGGFDSTVASYLTNKRGLITHFCFFNLGGRSHELGVKEVSYFLWRHYGASHSVKFVTVPFEEVVTEILENISNSQMGVILKRMMLRVASRVAEEFDIPALVTGESVAQVSSQTLTNLSVIDKVTDTLVMRPLITMDKGDIIDLSRRIGTEEFAANMPEYCGVISVRPTTRASLERIEKEEQNFDWTILNAAYDNRVTVPVSAVASDLDRQGPAIEESGNAAGATVIDIRPPNEEEQNPLPPELGAEKIPFYQLNTRFPRLSSRRHYLLYCDKGVMSKLHAAHLLEAGHNNVGVYRPQA